MDGKIGKWLLCLSLAAVAAVPASFAEDAPPTPPGPAADGGAPRTDGPGGPGRRDRGPGGPGRRGPGGRGGPFGFGGQVFGEVTAVRGNVLQIRTPEGQGLTRVILADDARIIKDETLPISTLKPGDKVMGAGRQVEGTGTASTPLKVDVQRLEIQGGGAMGGGPFGFFGGGGGPLMRGQKADVFRKQNYSGDISFNAQVKSVAPIVLADDQGNALNVVIGDAVEVHQRVPRPVKEGDVTAGARLMAMGEPTSDGLLNAHMVMLMGEGRERSSMTGTVLDLTARGATVRPRFAPQDVEIEIDPAAKVYSQEALDIDTIKVGDTLTFTGKVVRGGANAPSEIVVRTITPAGEQTPKIDQGGGGPFGGGQAITASVTGKILSFNPLKVTTDDGRTVTVTVPGQVSYVRYAPQDRGKLKQGQTALFAGKTKEGGLLADLIILNPPQSMGGPGF